MRALQRTGLALVIGAPVIVGALLLLHQARASSVPLGSVGFRKLGVVHVEGIIYEAASVVKQLQQLREDNMIAGVLMRIDSPGGGTAPSQEIYDAVWKYRECGKPLIVSMGNVAASGGYYIACPARRIFADAGTLTGSIGVIMTVPLYKELAKKVGIEMRTFKAGDYKDLANPYRTISPQEHRMIQGLLEDTHDRFIDDVAKARFLEREALLPVADGRIFTGRQALKAKLIDTLGSYEAALAYLRTITGLGPAARIINKKETGKRIREWFTSEMMHVFPHIYRVFAPLGMQSLAVFE
ncbi:MAG: signal peptide peptidase SppA [Chitinispirillaceae bacterium]|nr:signal peptide peptidase SppA [Chitinispirillaceae bacterium]